MGEQPKFPSGNEWMKTVIGSAEMAQALRPVTALPALL